MAGELEQPGMELDGLALACEHRGLEVVVEERPGRSAKVLEGLDVAAQEALHRLVEREEHVDRAGPAEHHDEGRQRSLGAAHLDLAEVSPVDLGLFAGQRTQAKVGFGHRPGSQAAHEPAGLSHGARIAAGHDHLVDAGGAELGYCSRVARMKSV